MIKMRFLGDLVADNAKGGGGCEGAENEGGEGYPSFIVRLSFVIGSFKVGKR